MTSPVGWLRAHRTAGATALATGGALLLGSILLIPASASPSPTASPIPSQAAAPAASTASTQRTAEPAPRPASRTHKARHIPARPRDTHTGKRIVYDKALMTVWLMDANNEVVGRYPVVGRFDRPKAGTYHVFRKSRKAFNPNSKVTFNNMVRFTYGPDTKSPIGFHSIPRYYDGRMMHSTKQLGLAIARGGCVRLSEQASEEVYRFLNVGDLVVVLPSP